MQDSPLLNRFAQRHNLPPESALRRLFLEAVPRWQRPFVRLHSRIRPRLYAGDWRLIAELAKATTMQGVDDALDRWHHSAGHFESFGRNHLHWRVSGRRVLALAGALLNGSSDRHAAPKTAFVPTALDRAGEVVRTGFNSPVRWVQLHG